jgi:hypothetical protein
MQGSKGEARLSLGIETNPARLGSDFPDHATQGLATTQLRAWTEQSPNRRKVQTKNGGKRMISSERETKGLEMGKKKN